MKKYIFSFCILLIGAFNQMVAESSNIISFNELLDQIESSEIVILKNNSSDHNATFNASHPHKKKRNIEYPVFIIECETEKEKEKDNELTSSVQYLKCCQHFSIIYFISENEFSQDNSKNEFLSFSKEINSSLEKCLFIEFQVFRI